MSTHTYAVINRQNGLPILVFEETLPNLEDPPRERGIRLASAAMTAKWVERPDGYPFVTKTDDIPGLVEQLFTVIDVPHGFVPEVDWRKLLANVLSEYESVVEDEADRCGCATPDHPFEVCAYHTAKAVLSIGS